MSASAPGESVTSDTKLGVVWAYTFNNAGQMAQATSGATVVGIYTYDGLDRLAVRVTASPAATTHYAYDRAGHVLMEANGTTGATGREYIWVDDLPLAVESGGGASPALYYVHADHLDRPILMTDGTTKAVVWKAVYKPFGEVVSITGTATLDARFPGQWFELETGLHDNWHRHYDPTTGRYTQPDPLGFVNGPSVYGYAGQSPLIWVDRRGLQEGSEEDTEPEVREEQNERQLDLWSEMYEGGREELDRFNEKVCRIQGELEQLGGGIPRFTPTPKGAAQFIFPNGMILRFDLMPGQYLGSQGPHINLQNAPGSLNPNLHLGLP